MTLRLVDSVTLAPLAGEMPRSRIMAGGRDTGAVADGKVLEAAIETDGRHLLFVTDDVPFEEGLHVQLFDRDWTRLDHADLGWMYATGNFRDLAIVGATRLRFVFFDAPLLLDLFDPPTRAWFRREPRGVHRPFGAIRHFELSNAEGR